MLERILNRKFLIGGILASAALIGMGVYAGPKMFSRSAVCQQETEQSKLERWLRDPRFKKLDLERYVDSVVYTPNFEADREYLQSLLEKAVRENNAELRINAETALKNTAGAVSINQTDGAVYGITRTLNLRPFQQVKSKIFFSKKAFYDSRIRSEDDTLSIFLHEAFHAAMFYNGIPFSKGESGKLMARFKEKCLPDTVLSDSKLFSAIIESFAYHQQLLFIDEGLHVSPGFKRAMEESYTQWYSVLQGYAKNDDSKGAFARATLNTLVRPPRF